MSEQRTAPPEERATHHPGREVIIDHYTPREVAARTQTVGVTKARLDFWDTLTLSVLAGAFISLGAVLATLILVGSNLGFGVTRLFSGIAFSLGLILVVVAGAELFTGNNLIVMSWVSRRIGVHELLRNWVIVYFGNFLGALSVVGQVYMSDIWQLNGFSVGATALTIALAKVQLGFWTALFRGILCNALVCLAVWLASGGRSIIDKVAGIVFPISAFVAVGFEHSIANMYFIPIGMALRNNPQVLAAAGLTEEQVAPLTIAGLVGNLIPVTIGNIIGGSVMVGMVYWFVYLRKAPDHH